MLSRKKENKESWIEESQLAEAKSVEIYKKSWWEKWIIENRKLHYFIGLIILILVIYAIGHFSGLWFHIGSLFIFGLILSMVEILRIKRNMYYVVETRLAGDKIVKPDGSFFIVQDTETRLIEIPDFAYPDFKHYGTHGAPLPIQSSRVIFADYVDLDENLIYHSPDLEFANAILSANANSDIIAERKGELEKIDKKEIERIIDKLEKIQRSIREVQKKHSDKQAKELYGEIEKLLTGKLTELKALRAQLELERELLVSKDFKRMYKVTPSVKRNLFLHYKHTIPDLRSALFILQNNLREFADAIAASKIYISLNKALPLDVRRRLGEIFERLGYSEIFNLEEKEEVKEHVVRE